MNSGGQRDARSVPGAVYLVLVRNWPVLACVCAFSIALNAIGARAGDEDAWVLLLIPFELLVWALVFSVAFSFLLHGLTGSGAVRPAAALQIYWRDTIIRVSFGLLAALVAGVFGLLASDSYGNVYLFNIVVWVFLFLAYGLIGTWLASAAAGEGKRLSDAFRRGRVSFAQSYGQMLIHAGLPTLLSGAFFAYSDGKIVDPKGNFYGLNLVCEIVGTGFELIANVAIAVILLKAYLAHEEGGVEGDKPSSTCLA